MSFLRKRKDLEQNTYKQPRPERQSIVRTIRNITEKAFLFPCKFP